MSLNANPEFGSLTRERILRVIVLSVAVLYTARLGYLQIIKSNELLQKSETQAIKQRTKEPFRGCMYDRNGKMIVENSGSFCVTITPNDFNPEIIPVLAKLTNLEESYIRAQYKNYRKQRFAQIKILRDASPEIVSAIEEFHNDLPGVDITIETKRVYNLKATAAHLFGYRAMIDDKDLANVGNYYQPRDMIGKTGLESSFEAFLRGNKGVQYVAVNAAGEPIESFNNGKMDRNATEGADLYLGLDSKLQEIAEREMKTDQGGVVALDPRNGEVLAYVSKPDYNLDSLSGANFSKEFARLNLNPEKPLFNRAMQTQYPPGSTWKMLMGLAALQEGIITPETKLVCGGGYFYGGRLFKCHGGSHGAINLRRAIHVSCNTFFYRLGPMLGIDNYNKYGKMFGFGQRTGIDIAGEKSGLLASREFYARYGVTGKLIDGRLVNLGIGQGEIGVTPLQMAMYCGALANKGTLFVPHVVRSILNKQTGKIEKQSIDSFKVSINPEYFDVVQAGMYDVCNVAGGTATNVKIDSVKVCGKTGTAQNPHGKDHSWFICYAPAQNPTIAICVMVENAGFGATRAAPIARAILDAHFHPDKYKDDDMDMEKEKSSKDSSNQNNPKRTQPMAMINEQSKKSASATTPIRRVAIQ